MRTTGILRAITPLGLWLGGVQSAGAQPAEAAPVQPTARVWSADGLQRDVDVLARVLVGFHPALAKYAPRAAFDARVAALRAAFATPTSPAAAIPQFAAFVTALRDGHTYVNPYNQGAYVRDTLFGGATRLPFTFRVLPGAGAVRSLRAEEVLVVTRDLTRAASGAPGDRLLPSGTVVRALDGVPVGAVLDSLLPLSRGDGHTDALRRARLGVRADQAAGRVSAAPFDLYAPLLFPVRDARRTLTVRRPGERRDTTVAVALLTHAERRTRLAAEDSTAGSPRWSARRLDPRTALVRLGSFVTWNDTVPPTRWFDSTLAALAAAGVDRLVVDVRGNEGGSTDLAHAVAERLTSRPVPCDAIGRILVAAAVPDSGLFRYATSWRNDWRRPLPASAVQPAPDGRWRLRDSAGAWPVYGTVCDPPPAGTTPFRWSGRVAVLADEANSSATFLFLTLVRRHGLAPIVGRPAGGNQRGINGGLVLFTRLPYSGVEVDVPFFAQEPAELMPDAPLAPDVAVGWTSADIAAGRDPDVDAAARLLSGGRLVGDHRDGAGYAGFAPDVTRRTGCARRSTGSS